MTTKRGKWYSYAPSTEPERPTYSVAPREVVRFHQQLNPDRAYLTYKFKPNQPIRPGALVVIRKGSGRVHFYRVLQVSRTVDTLRTLTLQAASPFGPATPRLAVALPEGITL